MTGIVVIGGGQAGSSLVTKLRSIGYQGDLTLICGEPVLPYQRPPLSKKYLMGEMDFERLYLHPASYYEDAQINLRLGQRVDAIDADARTLSVAGETLGYDQLALTTGSTPRRLPEAIGGNLDGVHLVRTVADVDAMAPEFESGRNVLIVGGGYIGLEAAAVAATLGLDVTLIEMADRILQRVAAPETAGYFRRLHREHGVDIREGTGLQRLLGDKRVDRAILTDGSEIAVDFVVVGVGIEPANTLATGAGLRCDNGIEVDVYARTSAANIWSAGDCASFPYRGQRIRLESVQNAIDQAEIVAENMMGANKAYDPHPWFWSDQYDVKLQIAGLNSGYDKIVLRPGEREHMVSHWYYKENRLVAVDAMNDPRGYMVGKRLIEAGKSPAPEIIAAHDTDLKALLRS